MLEMWLIYELLLALTNVINSIVVASTACQVSLQHCWCGTHLYYFVIRDNMLSITQIGSTTRLFNSGKLSSYGQERNDYSLLSQGGEEWRHVDCKYQHLKRDSCFKPEILYKQIQKLYACCQMCQKLYEIVQKLWLGAGIGFVPFLILFI